MEKIIFDFDGVIIADVDFDACLKRALTISGINYTEEQIQQFNDGLSKYEHITNLYEPSTFISFLSMYSGLELTYVFFKNYMHELRYAIPNKPNKDVIDTLKYLKEYYEMVILTNWFKESQEARLIDYGIIDYFSEMYTAEQYVKPQKEAYLLAAGSTPVSNCVMIGDNYEIDILGAQNANMRAIYLNKNGSINNEHEINNIKELKKIL